MPSGGRGREFESPHPDQELKEKALTTCWGLFLFGLGRGLELKKKFDKFAGSEFERAKRARRVAGRTLAINLLTPTNISL